MDPILLLRHGAAIPAGHLGSVLDDHGIPAATVPLYAGAAVPDDLGWAGIVSLGGVMGAYDEPRHPFLAAEKQFLRRAVDAGVPVLGICLGCQLLADALGGRAYRAARTELALVELDLTAAGAADPVVAQFDGPVLSWHQDTWDPPRGAEILAATPGFPHAFRMGSALGIQSHPEVTPEIFSAWAAIDELDHFAATGVDRSVLGAAVAARGSDTEALAVRLFEAWLRHDVGIDL